MRLLALVSAVLIAYCLSMAGEMTLGRRSRSLGEYNESFLVGLTVTSTAFFPLSLLLHGFAFNVTWGGLILLTVAGSARRLFAIQKVRQRTGFALFAPVQGFTAKVLVVLIALLVAQFIVLNYRLSFLWDGYQIWATKALVIYDRGELTQSLLTPHTPDLMSFPNCCDGVERDTAYPQTVPLFEALVARSEGRFVWEAVKAVFPIFFLSLLISTFEAARAFVPLVPALAAPLLLGLVPAIAYNQSVGGYADMPQAALVAGCMAALFRDGKTGLSSFRHAAPWLLGGVLLVKNEGSILFVVICVAISVAWASRGIKFFANSLRRYAGAIVIAGICAGLRGLYISWMDLKDPSFGPYDNTHLVQAFSRLWTVPVTCANFMFNRGDWGLFWPVFFVSVLVVLWKGGIRERSICGAALMALAMYTSIFYFTNWEPGLHIEQAYPRLLVHVAPAAAILTVIAYQYLAGRSNPEPRLDC